jgi:hypothetical protein
MNIPDDVVKAADDAYWRDGRQVDEYTVIAEWARREVEAERDALRAQLDSIAYAWEEYDDWRKEPYIYPDGTRERLAEDLYTVCRDALGYGHKRVEATD